jgi:outer membrane receptor protein involved in Fe transport
MLHFEIIPSSLNLVEGKIKNRVGLTAGVYYRGERERDASAGDPRPPVGDSLVASFHVRVEDLFTRGLDGFVTFDNLFDETYYGPSNYPPKIPGVIADDIPYQGFRVTAGLSYSFDWR